MKKVIRDRLILEGSGCKRNLASVEAIYDFLIVLTAEINMRVLVPPIIVRVPVECAADQIKTQTDWGISGCLIWLESGASVHTWPESDFVAVDIFSCKPFDHKRAENLFAKVFEPSKIETMESFRGGEHDI